MVKPEKRGIERIVAALGFSLQGLLSCWRNEAAFKQEALASIILIPTG